MIKLTYKMLYELYVELKRERKETPYCYEYWREIMHTTHGMTLYKSLEIIHQKDKPKIQDMKEYHREYNQTIGRKEYNQKYRERNIVKMSAYQKEYRNKMKEFRENTIKV